MPSLPQNQFFTGPEAAAQGLDAGARRALVLAGRWHRPRRGIWTPGALPEDPVRAHALAVAAALATLGAGAVVSHDSAALLHGLTDRVPRAVHLTLTTGSTRRYPGLFVHRAGLPPADVVDGITSVSRTVLDLARRRGAGMALSVADTALRTGATTPADLAATLAACGGWHGVVQARAVVGLADGRSESVLESVSRWELSVGGVPAPDLQVVIGDEHGPVGRVDFHWGEAKVVGEADGLGKYTDPQVLRAEKVRQERLESLGLTVVRWGWRDVTVPGLREELLRRLRRHVPGPSPARVR